jgi:hypothetical protein
MIVRPNGSYEQNGLFPSSNWYTNEPDNYIIDESTEQGLALAQKIIANYPNYNLVVDDGKLVDVTLKEPGDVPDPEPVFKPEQEIVKALASVIFSLGGA